MFIDVITRLMEDRGMNRSELSAASGIPYTTIDGWFKKGADNVRLGTLLKLSECFDVSLDYLADSGRGEKFTPEELRLLTSYRRLDEHGRRMVRLNLEEEEKRIRELEREQETEEEQKVIPLFTTMAAAGFAAPMEGVDFELIPVSPDVPDGAQFAVLIDGDSMEPYIHDGERVYCVKDARGVHVGDVGVFCVDGAYYCKQYCTDGTNIFLVSLNRARADADITIWGSGNRSITLLGRVLLRTKVPKP